MNERHIEKITKCFGYLSHTQAIIPYPVILIVVFIKETYSVN